MTHGGRLPLPQSSSPLASAEISTGLLHHLSCSSHPLGWGDGSSSLKGQPLPDGWRVIQDRVRKNEENFFLAQLFWKVYDAICGDASLRSNGTALSLCSYNSSRGVPRRELEFQLDPLGRYSSGTSSRSRMPFHCSSRHKIHCFPRSLPKIRHSSSSFLFVIVTSGFAFTFDFR